MTDFMQKGADFLMQLRQEALGQLERIDAAHAVLGVDASSAKTTRPRKPCCTKGEVIDVVASLLRDNGSLTAAEIEELAKDKLANEQNKSLSGFAMRFKEALRDPQFVATQPGTYELSSSIPNR